MNKKSNELLSQVLQGLKMMCNHCQVKDCEMCWSHDICDKIIKYFQTIPPPYKKNLEGEKTPSPKHKRYTPKF